jgi:CheY-like chemotaxis protein
MALDQKSVLIVDDELDILHVIRQSLKSEGVGGDINHIYAFASPRLALEHFKSNHNYCAIILSDVKCQE